MAEFCPECWNKLTENRFAKEKYILSKDLDLCERCRQYKPRSENVFFTKNMK